MKKSADKTYLFEQAPISSAVASLAIPTVLSSLVTTIYNLVDTLFVGMVNDPVETAAVTLAAPVLLAFNAINNLFGVGSSSLMSRSLGKKDYETVYRTSAFGFYCSVFCGIIFSLACILFQTQLLSLLGTDAETVTATAEYLRWTVMLGATPAILNVVMAHLVRSEGAAMHASIGTMSGCILNIILDPFFILPFGLNLGAEGAGLATLISNCVACIYFFVLLYVKRGRTYVCIHPKKFGFRKHIVKGVFVVGVPASVQNLLNVTGQTILNNFTAAYGATAVSAMGIAFKVNTVPTFVAMGMSQGIMSLVSYNFASGDYSRMKKAVTYTAKVMVVFLCICTVVIFAGAGFIISLFMKDAEIVAYGTSFMRAFVIALPFLGIDFLGVAVFQAVGMGQYALIFAILRKIVLEIPAMIILNKIFPLYGLPYASFVAEFVLAIAAVVMLLRFFKKYSADGRPVQKK